MAALKRAQSGLFGMPWSEGELLFLHYTGRALGLIFLILKDLFFIVPALVAICLSIYIMVTAQYAPRKWRWVPVVFILLGDFYTLIWIVRSPLIGDTLKLFNVVPASGWAVAQSCLMQLSLGEGLDFVTAIISLTIAAAIVMWRRTGPPDVVNSR